MLRDSIRWIHISNIRTSSEKVSSEIRKECFEIFNDSISFIRTLLDYLCQFDINMLSNFSCYPPTKAAISLGV